MSMEPLHIYSDVICPWCFLGKIRLDKALEERRASGKENPAIYWHPYELDPETPEEGVNRLERLVEKYGADRIDEMDSRLSGLFRAEGLDFKNMKHIEKTPNTFLAHRLTAYAQTRGKGHEMAGLLFEAHFLKGQDVGKLETLVELGAKLGFPKEALEQHLESNEEVAALRREEEEAQAAGLRGVPYYLINRHPMYGAQELETFRRALDAVAHE